MEYRHNPIQERAQNRIASIITASKEAIAIHGPERFTTNHVAQLAGCSIGTVYRYFPDRVAILDEVLPNRHAAQQTLDSIKAYIDYIKASGNAEMWTHEIDVIHGMIVEEEAQSD